MVGAKKSNLLGGGGWHTAVGEQRRPKTLQKEGRVDEKCDEEEVKIRR